MAIRDIDNLDNDWYGWQVSMQWTATRMCVTRICLQTVAVAIGIMGAWHAPVPELAPRQVGIHGMPDECSWNCRFH